MATVIIGAGIVGVSTAYYLSVPRGTTDASSDDDPKSDWRKDADVIHLVEMTDRLFASASGYAGGFLARDWFAPEMASLAALSFDQHEALSAQYDGAMRWGYAISTALSYGLPGSVDDKWEGRRGEDWLRQGASRSTSAPTAETAGDDSENTPSWLHRQKGDRVDVLADDGTAGQVEPLPFCQFLLETCQARGVQLHQPARVVAVGRDEDGRLASVTLEKETTEGGEMQTVLHCTRLVITAGAWTPRVFKDLFPREDKNKPLPVTNYAGHSLVVRVNKKVKEQQQSADCYALFAAGGTMKYCPEIFGRANGTLYLAGLNSSTIPLPDLATDAVPSADQLDDLLATCRRMLGEGVDDKDIEILRTGLCHRPATPWGFPLVLRLLDEQLERTTKTTSVQNGSGGVFVAAGHGPWGISMGPGTGMVLAELVQGRPLSADISDLGFH